MYLLFMLIAWLYVFEVTIFRYACYVNRGRSYNNEIKITIGCKNVFSCELFLLLDMCMFIYFFFDNLMFILIAYL